MTSSETPPEPPPQPARHDRDRQVRLLFGLVQDAEDPLRRGVIDVIGIQRTDTIQGGHGVTIPKRPPVDRTSTCI